MTTPTKQVPIACIRWSPTLAYCGRNIEKGEFTFENAAYAVQHYRNGNTIRVCPSCVTAAEDSGLTDTSHLAPMATRGEKNTK